MRPSALPAAPPDTRFVAAQFLGGAIALVLSLRLLARSLVWRTSPAEDVLEGQLFIFRNRLIVTLLIAAAISVTALVRMESLQVRAALLAAGVVIEIRKTSDA